MYKCIHDVKMNSTPNDVIRADYSSQALSIDSKIKKNMFVCLQSQYYHFLWKENSQGTGLLNHER